jgi:hypothetical protein
MTDDVDCSAVTVPSHSAHPNVDNAVRPVTAPLHAAHTLMLIAVPSQPRRMLLTHSNVDCSAVTQSRRILPALMSIAVPSQSRRMLLSIH